MPAKDIFHDTVKTALIKEGWTITHDPYRLEFGLKDVYVDLAAEYPLAAERDGSKIAVEVKSFRGVSEIRDFESALGQYLFYGSLMSRADSERKLYLAITDIAFANTFQEPITRPAMEDFRVALIIFRPSEERIVRWIP
jgi:hypothetical protein